MPFFFFFAAVTPRTNYEAAAPRAAEPVANKKLGY
jgi:hypothetical protein